MADLRKNACYEVSGAASGLDSTFYMATAVKIAAEEGTHGRS